MNSSFSRYSNAIPTGFVEKLDVPPGKDPLVEAFLNSQENNSQSSFPQVTTLLEENERLANETSPDRSQRDET